MSSPFHSSMEEEGRKRSHDNNNNNNNSSSSSYLDWRGRGCDPEKHGGKRAAAFVLALQAFEIAAVAGVGSNLLPYLTNHMHLSLSTSANIVTNFIATLFLLSLLGGFLSHSFLPPFLTLLLFSSLEFSGFLILFFQASLHSPSSSPTPHVDGFQKSVLFVGLYVLALGSGCVKPNMIAFGAHQIQFHDIEKKKKSLPSYFNAAYFAFSLGELLALSAFVSIQTHFGMRFGFAASALSMLSGLLLFLSAFPFYVHRRPRGDLLTPLAQVLVAAFWKRNMEGAAGEEMISRGDEEQKRELSGRLQWLNKACVRETRGVRESKWRLCTVEEVERTKSVISVIPIVGCTIVFNTILAQLQTFSLQQASSMDPQISKHFSIPPASMQAIPYLLLLFLVPIYDRVAVPLMRRLSGRPRGITALQRMGAGLAAATASMAAAAAVERWRRERAERVSVLWVSLQYIIFGVAEMLTAVGLLEFLYEEGEEGMESLMTGVTYFSYSLGFYMSSVLVSAVDSFTGGWLRDSDLDKDRLDLFYWLLVGVGVLNFFAFLFCSTRFFPRPR